MLQIVFVVVKAISKLVATLAGVAVAVFYLKTTISQQRYYMTPNILIARFTFQILTSL